MNQIADAYDQWSSNYDTVVNRTRDLDEQALQQMLNLPHYENVLELGCGTGKNSLWLASRAKSLVGFDLSDGMLEQARKKVREPHVQYISGDLNRPLPFEKESFQLVTCNLVLEHIEHLEPLFKNICSVLSPGGQFFMSELHPAKQYLGSKARFEKNGETIVLSCFTHHLTDYLDAANAAGLQLVVIKEWFDADDRSVPRLLSILFKRE